MTRHRGLCALVPPCAAVTLLMLSPSCGFGSAAVAAGVSGGGGASNAPSTPAGLSVVDARTSPARLRLVLTDAESDAATVEFFYVAPATPGVEQRMTALATNPVTLEASPTGVAHELAWNYALENDLPADQSFLPGVAVVARVRGGVTQSTAVDLGNDAPVVTATNVGEVRGIAALPFAVGDSSGDLVAIAVEFQLADDPTQTWNLARPASLATSLPTPDFAFTGIEAVPGGSNQVFFWDTDFDLANVERRVTVRFTAQDGVATGVAAATDPFVVDNNDEPVLQIDEGTLLENTDRTLGIPVPFRLLDAESDDVRAVFQWRVERQADFPPVDTDDTTALATQMRNEAFLRQKQICVPAPSTTIGEVVPVGPDRVRLPEVMSGQHASAARRPLVGRRIDFLRPRNVAFTRLADQWAGSPLSAPVGLVPQASGTTAVVLDTAAGSARILDLDLDSGEVLRAIATVAGNPTAMAASRHRPSMLVATDQAGLWRLFEVFLDGQVVQRAERPTGGISGPVRGVESLGDNVALLTLGSALVRVDWQNATRLVTVLDGLVQPTGVVRDRLREGSVYLADSGGPAGPGRILRFDLDTGTEQALPAFGVPNPRPLALALGRDNVLRVLCEPLSVPQPVVFRIALEQGIAPPRQTVAPTGATAIAAGPDGLTVLTVPSSADLFAVGGIEQRRVITAYDTTTATATIDRAFAPSLRPGQHWRLAPLDPFLDSAAAGPLGTAQQFVWDSSAAPSGDGILLRGVPIDSETGLADQTTGVVVPATPFHDIGSPAGPGFGLADVDRDGDVDLLQGTSVFTQVRPGVFQATGSIGTQPRASHELSGGGDAIADINGDGRPDLVRTATNSGNGGGALAIFFQDVAGSYAVNPLIVTDPVNALPPLSRVVCADLDRDGRTDLLATTFFFLTVWFQDSTGGFPNVPLTFSFATGLVTDVATADIDGDGLLDFAFSHAAPLPSDPHPAGVAIALQSPPRTFTITNVPLSFSGITGPANAVDLADYDGDGDIDIISGIANSLVANPNIGVTVALQNAQGGFVQAFSIGLAELTTDPTDLHVADVNGDGVVDIVANSNGRGLLFQQGPAGTGLGPPQVLGSVVLPTSADVDGDGRLDLPKVGGGFLTQGVAARLAPAPVVLGGPNTIAPRDLLAGDFDRDGRMDLLTTDDDSSQRAFMVSFRQRPNGTYDTVRGTLLPGPSALFDMTAGDLDGDGDTDAAYTDIDRMVLALLDGPVQFQTSTLAPVTLRGIRNGDLDGDGDLDLVCSDGIRFQTAPGQFAPAAGSPTPEFAVVVDIDRDGDFDLVAAPRFSGPIALFVQTAPGVFAAAATPFGLTGDDDTRIAAADLDDDGDVDLVVASAGASLTLLRQTAPGTFTPTSLGGGAGAVVVADFDADGLLDIASNQGGITIHRQVADGTFSALPTVIGTAAFQLVAADLDGDETIDLAATDLPQSVVRIFRTGR